MKIVKVLSSKIETFEGKAKLIYDIEVECDGEIKRDELYYEVDEDYKDYLCYETADCVFTQLLSFVLRGGYDFQSNVPLSDSLVQRITTQFIPMLTLDIPNFRKPKFIAERKEFDWHPTEVVLGMSLGVDSFYSLYENNESDVPDNYKISMLSFFENGAHHMGGNGTMKEREAVFLGQLDKYIKFCDTYSYKKLIVRSNITTFLIDNFWYDQFYITSTYRNLGTVLALQKLIKTYYYSSGFASQGDISLNAPPANYDRIITSMFSTNCTKFYISGGNKKRLEKIESIQNFEPSYNFLNVCSASGEMNCGECIKCKKTLVELEVAGCLEKYKNCFNLDKYEHDKDAILKWLYQNRNKSEGYINLFKYMKEHNIKLKKSIIAKSKLHQDKLKIKKLLSKMR